MRLLGRQGLAGFGLQQLVMILSVIVLLAAYASAETHATSSMMTARMTRVSQNPCNPCNPCAAKNPCNPCAAGGGVNPKLVSRPAGTRLYAAPQSQLIAEGKALWENRSLGTSALACSTCHTNFGNLNASFLKPYPHQVDMPLQRSGLKQVDMDEMVQFCMVVPMAAEPLGWNSRELAALTAYTQQVQKGFVKAVAANPSMLQATANPCNPCAAKMRMNPCNPCTAKNPCGKWR